MANDQYIKLFRSITDWQWYTDVNVKAVYLHLLLVASIEPCRRLGVPLARGETLVSRKSLSEACGLSQQEVRTALEKLQRTGEIKVTAMPNNQGTKVKLVNYEKYNTYRPKKEGAEVKTEATDEQYSAYINQ